MRSHILRLTLAALAVIVCSLPALAGRDFHQATAQTVYVPVYSHIYQGIRGKPYNLSTMLSIRNVDYDASLTITQVNYYNSNGKLVKNHLADHVTLPPMATYEVYIPERDTSGGSGANFTVKWQSEEKISVPVIQAVMIGTASTQGISIVCDGVTIAEE